MHLVILDGYTANPGDLSWEGLKEIGALTVYDTTPPDEAEIKRRIGDAEMVFTNKIPISAATMDACPNMKYIGVLATGYNIVDVEAARERGVTVTNIPAYSTMSVAQLAMALLLEICHHAGHHDKVVHEGKWENCAYYSFWDYPLIELDGKTLGIIGLGTIGKAMARMAGAFGMKVLAYSPHPSEEGRKVAEYASLDELYQQSDVISLHCPLFPETERIINAESIARMKDGVILLNTSRGGLVDEQDVKDALESGKIFAYGLDVVSVEPIRGDNPLLQAPNCIMTPHIGWAPLAARKRLIDQLVKNARAYLDGQPVNRV